MNDRVWLAASNNAHSCDVVCRSHGIETVTRPRLWVALERAPRFYPDAVTLLPAVVAEEVVGSVRAGPGCAVKDSFACVDLGRHGFDELFRAQWIFHEAPTVRQPSALIWSVVETEAELSEWVRAADLRYLIRSDLMLDPSVRILGVRATDGVVAGAIVNRTGSAVGVSNVFTTAVAVDEVWASLPHAISAIFPSLSIVGYNRGHHLDAALAAGFTTIGALRIWLRPAAPA